MRPDPMPHEQSLVSVMRWISIPTRAWSVRTMLGSLLFVACADAAPNRVDPDALVQSPVERIWRVGGVDDTTLVFESLSRDDVVADGRDRLLVIDRTRGRIAVLDSTGTVVGTWGTPGPGPGQFLFPLTLAVAPDGAVHVFDAERNRLVIFSADGQFLREEIVRSGRPFRFRFRTDSTVVGSAAPRSGGAARLMLQDGDAWQTLDSILPGSTGMIERVCDIIGYAVEPVFQPLLAWDARGDTIVSSVGAFAITVRTPGAAPRVIARDTTHRSTDRALAARELGAGRTIQLRARKPCTIPTEQLLGVAHIEPRMPAYVDLTLGTHGDLWATRDVLSDEPTVADVFHLDSGFVRTLMLASARPALFLRSGVMISIERDADDVPMIVAYRVPAAVR